MILFTLSMLLAGTGWAQRTVTGKVTTEEDGEPLPGVSVFVSGTSIGTQTDLNGNYEINVPPEGATLEFRYIGYLTQTVAITQNIINVQLSTDTEALEQVVVTALGVTREEKSLGYAAQRVDGSLVNEVKDVNVVNSLTGKLAGVQIGTNSGAMGGSAKISVRGVSSITGDNNALFVVDGVPLENANTNSANQQRGAGGYDYGNSIQDINPDDIAELSVLKGAAATALWGSRGANGVILITTKKGKGAPQKGVGVTYRLGLTMDRVYVLPKYQNRYGGGTELSKLYYNEHPEAFPDGRQGYYNDNDGMGSYDLVLDYDVDESWGPKFEGQMYRPFYSWDPDKSNPNFGLLEEWSAQPNNIRNFFDPGLTVDNSIAVEGAYDKGTYRLSYSNLNQQFVLPNSEYIRNTIGLTGNYNASDRLSFSASANYVTYDATGRPGTGYDGLNVFQQFNQWGHRQWNMDQMKKNYKYEDGSQITWNRTSWDDPSPKYTDNPYWTRYENYQNDGRERVFGNAVVSYKINDFLTADVKFMTDTYSEVQEERTAIGSQDIPSYTLYEVNHMENNYQAFLRFDKTLSNMFSLNAYAGAQAMRRRRDINGGETVDGLSSATYNLNASVGRPNVFDNKSEKRINSLFGSASIGYDNQLYLDLTARNDWSSTLPVDNNSYFYPSASLAWVFSESANAPWLSFGKLRAAIAQVGNDTDPYNTALTYQLRQPFGSASRVSVPNALPNEVLKPEISSEYEFGTELAFLNNRLGLDVAYYHRKTKNQILSLSQSAATGYTSRWVNAGLIENKGFEVTLSGTPVKTADFSWDITANWAKNDNVITELTPDQKTYVMANAPFAVRLEAREGESMGSIVGYNYVFDEQGRKVVGANGTYLRSPEQEVIGSVLPDFIGGVVNSFRYKGIRMTAVIDYQKGGSFFSTTDMWGKYSGMFEETAVGDIREEGIVAEGVKEDGTPNDVVISAPRHFFSNQGYVINAADIVDASYIYLRELQIGYGLPNRITERTPFNTIRLSFVARNLWMIHSNSKHVDPTNITNSITNIQGIEGAALPSVRSFGLTLTVGL